MRLTTSNYVKLAFTLVYLPKKKKKSKHHEILTDQNSNDQRKLL